MTEEKETESKQDHTDALVFHDQANPDSSKGHGKDKKHKAHHKEKLIKISKSKHDSLEKHAHEREVYVDHLKRLQADFENYKKRVIREREQLRHLLTEDLILEILPILDNFSHALSISKKSHSFDTLFQGVEMIYKQMLSFLSSRNVVAIEAEGKPFDPRYHEAMVHEYSDATEDQIIEEIIKGYLINGKLLRASKVKVSKGKSPESESTGTSS